MQTKDFAAKVKAAGPADGLDDGQFKAVVSVFGNEDSVGDVVMPGAFKEDLARWESFGDPIRVICSHDWAAPFWDIGSAIMTEQSDTALQCTADHVTSTTEPPCATCSIPMKPTLDSR